MDLKRFGLLCRDATEEDDGMVELSLGLSVGGSARRTLKSGLAPRRREPGTGLGEAADNLAGSGVLPCSSRPPSSRPSQQGDLADGLDPQRRREMHALRRQEARKKRHEKQQTKGSASGGWDGTAPAAPGFCGSSPPPEGACSLDDGAALECQEQRCRARDREAREEEARHSVRRAGEKRDLASDFAHNPELYSSGNANPNAPANNPRSSPNFPSPNLPPFAAHPFPLMAMQYPFPPVQYVPMANGFGFPYMMPCWAPAVPSVAGGPNPATNVFQPVAYQAFQPFPLPDGEPGNEASPLGGDEADLSGGNGAGIQRARSWMGSSGSNSSSAISDHQSNSLQGGSSSNSDIRSHSSSALVAGSHPQVSPQSSNLVQGQSEHSISSHQNDVEVGAAEKKQSSNSAQPDAKGDPSLPQCASTKLEGMVSVNKPVPAATDESIPPPVSSTLPQMPCVSTTGNGPNGKTVTGFLYRYSSTEVSIVCVCHGSSFSPAEFVKHAGGTDITNPLRHIVVVPS